tara:strand:- start:1151 stop:2173 length:1023 start_codon:yes stop_codon:yes gene_type:complete
MTDTQTNEAENFDNIPETDTSSEDKFFGLKSSVGIDKESNIEIEVVDDRPLEDRKPPKRNNEDSEINDLSENANKRIKKLKYDYHEERRQKEQAERLRDEAVSYAKNAVTENERLSRLLGSGQQELVKQAKQKAEFAKQAATQNYKKAYEDGDADAIAKAQQILTEATFAGQQADQLPQQLANQVLQQEQVELKNNPVQQQPAQQQPVAPQPDKKAVAWQENNQWFGADEEMTNFAYGVHSKLVKENVDPTSKEYYDRVDQRMREVFPQEFETEDSYQEVAEPVESRKSPNRPPNVVAPATRNNGARPNKVKLTATQVSLARRIGITPEQYAAELIKEKR